MSSSISTSNVTSGFIDLATFDEIEKYMYGGPDATAYFVRETRKSTWFTQVPVVLSRSSGTPGFGQEWSVSVSRAGDYLLNTWLRLTISAATSTSGADFHWTKNLMHNLIKECAITFNDLVAARFDNYHLDFWAAFTVPASKKAGYYHMIGNRDGFSQGTITGGTSAQTLNLPLPFFFSRDSGVALPTAALPYNDMRITFNFRELNELVDTTVTGFVTPTMSDVQVWANYAIVSNDERKRMACAPRDILVEQVQTAPKQNITQISNEHNFDIRFSHAVKALFFGIRNKDVAYDWSNYNVTDSSLSAGVVSRPGDSLSLGVNPITSVTLVYENTARLSSMGSDYFHLVNPYYHAQSIPTEVGLHSYSYSLDLCALDPMGSTNYGKLTNVSIRPVTGPAIPTTSEFVVTAVNNNIIRVSGGALGFPVL